jgi:hypothetical protein
MIRLRSSELTRRSTRHVSEITAIASKLQVTVQPSSFHVVGLGEAFLHSELISKHPEQENEMSSEVLLSNIIPFAGSGLVGYAIGFALKKILKLMLIIVGLIAGMFFVGVQLLQKYGYVSTVNWD